MRGEISYEEVAGYLEFELDGATVRLDALDDGGDLFVIFRDATSAKTTYGAGRFLAIARPKDGAWFVDFNKAYNPPCAFPHTRPAAPTAPELDEGGGPGRRALRRAQVLIRRWRRR